MDLVYKRKAILNTNSQVYHKIYLALATIRFILLYLIYILDQLSIYYLILQESIKYILHEL